MTGFVPHPVIFHKIDSPKLQKQSQPQYFLIELTGHINVNRDLFDEKEGNECPVCHNWTPKEGGKYFYGARTLFPEMSTWDGSDFVHIHSPAIGGHFCTTRIIELARAKKWVGAHFESVTPRPYFVNLKSDKWLDEIAEKVRAEYPQLLP